MGSKLPLTPIFQERIYESQRAPHNLKASSRQERLREHGLQIAALVVHLGNQRLQLRELGNIAIRFRFQFISQPIKVIVNLIQLLLQAV